MRIAMPSWPALPTRRPSPWRPARPTSLPRRWCAPVLDLPPGAPMDDYLARRAELGAEEVRRRLLNAAALSHVLIDTGLDSPDLAPPPEVARAAGAEFREVVR